MYSFTTVCINSPFYTFIFFYEIAHPPSSPPAFGALTTMAFDLCHSTVGRLPRRAEWRSRKRERLSSGKLELRKTKGRD